MPAGSGSIEALSLTPDSGTTAELGGENIEIRSPPVRTMSGSNSARSRRRRLDDDSALKEKKSELNDMVTETTGKVGHVLQPSSSNIGSGSNNCVESGFYSPIPVSVCTARVWGAPPPKVFRGPWMSGVNRTSLDALTMEVSLPTPPRADKGQTGVLIPCANETEDHDVAEMMDVSVNSPGLALLGGAFGVSPNPRALGLSSGVERMMGMMGCGSSADSPMMAVFYSPRLVHNDHQ